MVPNNMKLLPKLLQAKLSYWRLFLPNRCVCCGLKIDEAQTGLCGTCMTATCYQTPICLGCGKPLDFIADYCGYCLAKPPLKVIAACSYHAGLGGHIALMKYQQQFVVLNPLIDALTLRIKALAKQGAITLPQAIVAVPLHPKKLAARGFNQAWLIAKGLALRLNLPLWDNQVVRLKQTPAQAGLSGKQRRLNMNNAFALRSACPYQRIALVDDVVTTGTTTNEINKLFEPDYIDVQVWCLARAEAPSLK